MLESEIILSELLGCSRAALYLDNELGLNSGLRGRLASILAKREKGFPLQYILGKTEFMGLEFKVTPEVFIPRQETEILVETVIKSVGASVKILDIGTGSGCIAVSLAKFLPQAKVSAVDISAEALKVGAINALFHNVRVDFIKSDLFKEITRERFDLLVSNPPYIVRDEIERLQPEVRHEPRIALDGGNDGLSFYRRLIDNAADYLVDGGVLIMEMGYGQKEQINKIIDARGGFEVREIVRDYNGIERVMVVKLMTKSEFRMTK